MGVGKRIVRVKHVSAQDQAFTNLINAVKRFLDHFTDIRAVDDETLLYELLVTEDDEPSELCRQLGITDPEYCADFWLYIFKSGNIVKIEYKIYTGRLKRLVDRYRRKCAK